MLRCLELAALGSGAVAPNPMVGCVVVHEGKIIGEGYHQKLGGPHAEVNAINSVQDHSLLSTSTIYVSLEPCSHIGRTPPCADLIIKKKFKTMVIACLDPFHEVNGKGIDRIRKAGIEVRMDVLQNEALELNRRFITFHKKKRPYIILKWAETEDGYVDAELRSADQRPLKISCEESDILHHRWRTEEAAILVGKNTAVMDNPSLTARKYAGRNPIRIVLDTKLELKTDLNVFDNAARTIVVSEKAREGQTRLNEVITMNNLHDLSEMMGLLHAQNIQSIIIEGGPTLQRSFYQADLWDEIRRFVAPFNIGEGVKALQLTQKHELQHTIGTDQLFMYRNG